MKTKDVKLLQSSQIRSIWNDEAGEWFFSVVDVVGALTESADSKQYIKKMHSRDPELNSKRLGQNPALNRKTSGVLPSGKFPLVF